MRASHVITGGLLVLVVLVSGVGDASAAGWPVADGSVALGFGAAYLNPDGGMSTHHGCDLTGAPGGAVAFPIPGVVRFAGRVPGPHGGTVLAVTVESDSGVLLTMLPLGDLEATTGSRVEEGDKAGVLAAEGDPSSEGPHLHVGVRVGGLYVDPLCQMSPPAAGAMREGHRETSSGEGATGAPGPTVSEAPATPADQRRSAPPDPVAQPTTETRPQPAELARPGGASAEARPQGGYRAAGKASAVTSAPRVAEQIRTSGSSVAGAERVRRAERLTAFRGQPSSARASGLARARTRSPLLQALGVRLERAARAWLVLTLALCGVVALWPIWRSGAALFSDGRNASASAAGSEVVAAPGR